MHHDRRGLTCVMTMTYFVIGCLMTHRLQTFGALDDLLDLTDSQSIVSKKKKTATLSKIPSIILTLQVILRHYRNNNNNNNNTINQQRSHRMNPKKSF
jgi:hypothetical protein